MDGRHGFERAMRAKTRLTGRCAHARYRIPETGLASGHGQGLLQFLIGSLERVRTARSMAFRGLLIKDRVQRPSKWLLSLICMLRVLQSPRNERHSMLPEE